MLLRAYMSGTATLKTEAESFRSMNDRMPFNPLSHNPCSFNVRLNAALCWFLAI